MRSALAAALVAAVAWQSATPRLVDTLADEGITPRPALPPALRSTVVPAGAGADATDARGYALAWWTGTPQPNERLQLFAIDRASGAWHHRELAFGDVDGAGPLNAITTSRRFIVVEMKQTPSASSSLVLARDLTSV